jgi:high-affinity Fe2+/Pb2+ permease
MKTIRKHLESLVLLLIVLMLFQSCVVYEKNSVSLDWAAKQELRAKVEMKTNETNKFKRISFENQHYYGIKKINGEITKTPLQADNLNKIQLQNKSTSTIATITTVLGSLIGVILAWYFIDTGGGNWLD